jgi:predicted metal-dependent peptidase
MDHSVTIALSIIAAAVAYIIRVLGKRTHQASQKALNDRADQRATVKLDDAQKEHLEKIEKAHDESESIDDANAEQLSKMVNDAFDD